MNRQQLTSKSWVLNLKRNCNNYQLTNWLPSNGHLPIKKLINKNHQTLSSSINSGKASNKMTSKTVSKSANMYGIHNRDWRLKVPYKRSSDEMTRSHPKKINVIFTPKSAIRIRSWRKRKIINKLCVNLLSFFVCGMWRRISSHLRLFWLSFFLFLY